ncbi:TPA: hypothetical protein ACIVON_002860 [Salmonella enterica subsp. enterica serovar Poona]|nr:hypothetical protein [Salmonella enterica]HEC8457970.1 hypothetical protein [Salmonella enterica subsp. enterica serovar Poona]
MKYIYSGPPSGVSLNEGDSIREVMLLPGQTVELEPDNEYVLALLAEGYLQEISPLKPQTTAKEQSPRGGAR